MSFVVSQPGCSRDPSVNHHEALPGLLLVPGTQRCGADRSAPGTTTATDRPASPRCAGVQRAECCPPHPEVLPGPSLAGSAPCPAAGLGWRRGAQERRRAACVGEVAVTNGNEKGNVRSLSVCHGVRLFPKHRKGKLWV